MSGLRRVAIATWGIVFSLAGGVSAGEIPVGAVGETGKRMHEILTTLQDHGFHGSALVEHEGKVILHQGYGVADPRTGRRNAPDTCFSTGSVTKQFTATGILHLVQEGKLGLEDPLTKFFDGVPPDKAKITVHHLLTHSSGLVDALGRDSEEMSRKEFTRRALSSPLEAGVGEEYGYSNAGYTLLALILEKVSGKPYEEYLRDRLYRPLGMEWTGLTSREFPPERVAVSHNAKMGHLSPTVRTAKNWNLIGNGGQLSTPADMLRWCRAIREHRLLSKELVSRMWTPFVSEGGEYSYGYGWSMYPSEHGKVVWHNGGAEGPGWSCAVYQLVEKDALFIVFSNKPMDDRLPVDDLVRILTRVLFGEPVATPPVAVEVPRAELDAIVGEYVTRGGGKIRVRAESDRLRLYPLGQAAMDRLFPSPMARRLRKYSLATRDLVESLAAGEEISDHVESDAVQGWRDWWRGFRQDGAFQGIDVHGTRAVEAALTYFTLRFEKRDVPFSFYWMDGLCEGGQGAEMPYLEVVPQGKGIFAGYSLTRGRFSVELDGDLLVDIAGTRFKARREDRQ